MINFIPFLFILLNVYAWRISYDCGRLSGRKDFVVVVDKFKRIDLGEKDMLIHEDKWDDLEWKLRHDFAIMSPHDIFKYTGVVS